MNYDNPVDLHNQRLSQLDDLESLKSIYDKKTKHQASWRRARAGVWLAPLVSACALANGHVNSGMNAEQVLSLEFASVLAAAGGFLVADKKRQQAFAGRRATALMAAQTVSELSIPTPIWVEQGLQPDNDANPVQIDG